MARINQKRHRNLQIENGRLKERIAELERTLHQLREQKRSIISQLEQVELRNTERIKELEKCLAEKVLLKTADVIAYERSRMKVSMRIIDMIDDIRKDVEQALKDSR